MDNSTLTIIAISALCISVIGLIVIAVKSSSGKESQIELENKVEKLRQDLESRSAGLANIDRTVTDGVNRNLTRVFGRSVADNSGSLTLDRPTTEIICNSLSSRLVDIFKSPPEELKSEIAEIIGAMAIEITSNMPEDFRQTWSPKIAEAVRDLVNRESSDLVDSDQLREVILEQVCEIAKNELLNPKNHQFVDKVQELIVEILDNEGTEAIDSDELREALAETAISLLKTELQNPNSEITKQLLESCSELISNQMES